MMSRSTVWVSADLDCWPIPSGFADRYLWDAGRGPMIVAQDATSPSSDGHVGGDRYSGKRIDAHSIFTEDLLALASGAFSSTCRR